MSIFADEVEAAVAALTPNQAEILEFPLRENDWRERLAFRFHLGAAGVNAVRQLVEKKICEEQVAPWWAMVRTHDLAHKYRLTAFGADVRRCLRTRDQHS